MRRAAQPLRRKTQFWSLVASPCLLIGSVPASPTILRSYRDSVLNRDKRGHRLILPKLLHGRITTRRGNLAAPGHLGGRTANGAQPFLINSFFRLVHPGGSTSIGDTVAL